MTMRVTAMLPAQAAGMTKDTTIVPVAAATMTITTTFAAALSG